MRDMDLPPEVAMLITLEVRDKKGLGTDKNLLIENKIRINALYIVKYTVAS